MGLAIEYEISSAPARDAERGERPTETEVTVAFHGADQELLLEQNAELLLALDISAHRWLRLDPRLHDRVRFDCGDYRATQLEELKLSARVAAQRVRETGQPFRFNPMSPRERRIIHLELTGAAGVRTMSEGVGRPPPACDLSRDEEVTGSFSPLDLHRNSTELLNSKCSRVCPR